MQNNKFILEFDRAELPPLPGQTRIEPFSLQLTPEEICMIRVEPGNEHLPLTDAALGLITPTSGRVLFLGHDWNTVAPEKTLRLRARIGRVFHRDGWISNLDVIENITLAQRHHTRLPAEEIARAADVLAKSFGLPNVPTGRPAAVPRRDLHRAEWVRAFIGRPDLLCLEQPGAGVATVHLDALAQAARNLCARGGAVLWITDDEREFLAIGNTGKVRHFHMNGAILESN